MIPIQEIKSESTEAAVRCLFLADAHLRDEKDVHYQALLLFLGGLEGPQADPREGTRFARQCSPSGGGMAIDHLFILGDFFDFWFSRRDSIYPGFRPIVDRLIQLKKDGVKIHFCEGNHDFFLEPYFSVMLGMKVDEDWAALSFGGKRVLIGHGDLVDRTNHQYLFLRRILRSRPFFILQKLLPLSVLWTLARKSSLASQELMGGAQERIMDRMAAFAEESFREGYDVVILGHCHKPQFQELFVAGGKKTFVTLGDWINHCSYLLYDERGFNLHFFRSEA